MSSGAGHESGQCVWLLLPHSLSPSKRYNQFRHEVSAAQDQYMFSFCRLSWAIRDTRRICWSKIGQIRENNVILWREGKAIQIKFEISLKPWNACIVYIQFSSIINLGVNIVLPKQSIQRIMVRSNLTNSGSLLRGPNQLGQNKDNYWLKSRTPQGEKKVHIGKYTIERGYQCLVNISIIKKLIWRGNDWVRRKGWTEVC